MKRGSAPTAALLALLSWSAVSAASPRWRQEHSPHTSQWRVSSRPQNAIETLPSQQTGRTGQPAGASVTALSSLLRGLLQRRHQHGRSGHGDPWAAAGGGRAAAAAGGGRTSAAAGGGRVGIWKVIGGSGRPRTTINYRRGPRTTITDRRGPRTTITDRRGPWSATGAGRHTTYAMAGGQWPGGESASGRAGLFRPTGGSGWHRTGHSWPFGRTPGRSHGRHGWGIVATIGRRSGCEHGRRGWSWPALPTEHPEEQPTEQPEEHPTGQPEEQPTGQPEEQPTEQPEEQPTEQLEEQPTGQPEEQPTGQPEEQPTGQPEDQPTEQPEEQPTEADYEDPALDSDEPTDSPTETEKQDCAEGGVIRDGECVCRDPRQFLDTILGRCVDSRPVIF